MEHAKANDGQAFSTASRATWRVQFDAVQTILGRQTVGIAQIAKDTGLSRQIVYRIKDDPAVPRLLRRRGTIGAAGCRVARGTRCWNSAIEWKKWRIIPARVGSPGLRLRARYRSDEWMTATSFYHEHGDLGVELVQAFPERLNPGYIVARGGRGSADGATGCRMVT
jgi:hypothetical protein